MKDLIVIETKIFNIKSALIESFKGFPLTLYSNDSFWSVREEIYPADSKFFLVYKGNKPVARACAIINSEIKYTGMKTGLIGFYECENDINTSITLINAIKIYFRRLGIEYIIGPMNGSTWQSYRVTEPDNNPPFFLDNYHKNWYKKQFIANDFQVIAKYYSTHISGPGKSYNRIEKYEKLFREKDILISPVNLAKFDDELKIIYKICINSFKKNFLYSRISYDEFREHYRKIQGLINPDFVLIAKDSSGEGLGFIFAVDNIYSNNKKSLVIKSIAIQPNCKIRGLGSLLVEKIHIDAFSIGYQEIYHALMYEYNPSIRILSDNSKIYHKYLLFGAGI